MINMARLMVELAFNNLIIHSKCHHHFYYCLEATQKNPLMHRACQFHYTDHAVVLCIYFYFLFPR